MTTASSIITDSYRESNGIAIGAAPSDAQNTEGLSRLQSIVGGVVGYDAGEHLQDWRVGTAGVQSPDTCWTEDSWIYPIINSRILLNHSTTQTLYLPERPENGSRIAVIDVNGALVTYNVTLDGNGRLIDGAATAVLSTAGLNKEWLYDADAAEWKVVTDLELTSEMPFPAKFDDYFIIKLAARLNPRYGRSLSDLSLARLADQQAQLEATYRQTRTLPAPSGVRRLRGPSALGYSTNGRTGRFGWMK